MTATVKREAIKAFHSENCVAHSHTYTSTHTHTHAPSDISHCTSILFRLSIILSSTLKWNEAKKPWNSSFSLGAKGVKGAVGLCREANEQACNEEFRLIPTLPPQPQSHLSTNPTWWRWSLVSHNISNASDWHSRTIRVNVKKREAEIIQIWQDFGNKLGAEHFVDTLEMMMNAQAWHGR